MAKLNTYELKGALEATLQLIGIIPGVGSAFETVRVSNDALVAFIQQYAGEDGTNGKQVELRKGSTNIEWRYVGDASWTTLIAIADLQGSKGDAGERIQMQKSSTAIQWKYESASTWTDLVLLSDLKGTNGTNGRTMWSTTGAPSGALGTDGDFANDPDASIMYGPKTAGSWGAGKSYKGAKGDTGTGLKNRGAWVTGTTYSPGDYAFSTGSATASSMWILNGSTDYVSNTLPKDDLSKWVEFVAPAGADGDDGKNVEMRNSGTVIQWRLVGDATWTDLVTVADLKGAKGDPGNTGANGKSVLTTTGAPANGFGTDGDFANDADAQVMYGPKAGGTWPAGKSYKGAPGTPGSNGAGVPVGGATGQVLTKRSATDLDTEWKTPAAGGGGGVTLDTAQTITGMKTFTGGTKLSGITEIAGGTILVSAAIRKAGPAEGGNWSPTAGVSQQVATMTADINAATIVFPNDPATGIEITIFLEKAIKSVTWVGGSMWGGSISLQIIGAPTTLRPGGHTFRMLLAETPNWYYVN